MKLGLSALTDLPREIKRPAYARSELSAGIVHIGLGNFHRAHQSWYLHRLMQQGKALDWAIIGAGVRAYDAAMRDRLLAQDCLTTLIELDPSGMSAEVIGPMVDYAPIAEGQAPLIAAMADPAIRIVSLTVTEGGYYIDPVSGGFDAEHEDIRHDAATPDAPRTAFGAIVAALGQRRAAGHGPFTVLSCDNLQGNGTVVRQAVTELARMGDQDLADWIEAEVTFPNSMVDCIVPATGPAEIETVLSLGIEDAAPVTHETFRQWVIEDNFCAGRPDWDLVGATFSSNVHAYEKMKIRILNGGHQVLANAGEILSVPTIADCMQDADIAAFFARVQAEGIVPYVDAVPDIEPAAYVNLITQRFANPKIHDTTRRVAFDGSSRHTGFVLPIVQDALASGGALEGLALVEALWARMCEGTREDGSLIEPNDPHWADLNEAAKDARTDPLAWLQQSQWYGDLATVAAFADPFADALSRIWSDGCRAVLTRYAPKVR